MNPVVTLIIVNYNSGAHLRACISALRTQTFREFEVLILDNASVDESLTLAGQAVGQDDRFSITKLDTNIGFAAANNLGASNANGKWLALLNPDTIPNEDWLDQLVQATTRYPDTFVFGSMQWDAANPNLLDGAGDRYLFTGMPWRDRSFGRLRKTRAANRDAFETFSPCGAAAFYRSDVFATAGGFDERFFCFVEDVDLGFRLRRAGYRCLQIVNANVLHVGGGAGGNSDVSRYYGTRNMVWCFFKNMPPALLLILTPFHIAALAILAGKALLRGNPNATFRGIRDATTGLKDILRTRHGGSHSIANAFDWNPLIYLNRRSSPAINDEAVKSK